jgi:hypothetical protein
MERGTELFAAIHWLVMGVSHLAHPRVWADFFALLRAKGHAGVFVNGMLSMGFGSVIVAFHNVWEGLPVILTVLGWAHVLKGSLCLVFPQVGLRSLALAGHDHQGRLVGAGVVLLLFSAYCWYLVLAR